MLVPYAMAVPVCFSITVISMAMSMPMTMAMTVSEAVAISGWAVCRVGSSPRSFPRGVCKTGLPRERQNARASGACSYATVDKGTGG